MKKINFLIVLGILLISMVSVSALTWRHDGVDTMTLDDLGNLGTIGNMTADYFIGNGSLLTDITTTETDPFWTANYSIFLMNNISTNNYIAENNDSVNNYILWVNSTNTGGTYDASWINQTIAVNISLANTSVTNALTANNLSINSWITENNNSVNNYILYVNSTNGAGGYDADWINKTISDIISI